MRIKKMEIIGKIKRKELLERIMHEFKSTMYSSLVKAECCMF